ncbi:MAG: hypothetical protein CL912_12335 [Deltaproteobacteria bacterium]|nr:hypothetical protein [Deltaproteobacteria bacterium]
MPQPRLTAAIAPKPIGTPDPFRPDSTPQAPFNAAKLPAMQKDSTFLRAKTARLYQVPQPVDVRSNMMARSAASISSQQPRQASEGRGSVE